MENLNIKTEVNTGLKLAESEVKAKGKLATFFRGHALAGNYIVLLETFKAAYVKHGGEVDSPIHSIRSTIDQVTKALIGKPEYNFEGSLGVRKIDGEYTLVDKGPKTAKSQRVEVVAANFAKKFKTEATKKAALLATARAMGIEIKF